MARETMTQQRQRAQQIEARMLEHYGPGACSLDYATPFQLTIAVILSAQCSDAAVNKVTPKLFERYPTPIDLAQARIPDVEDIIHSLGLYRGKAQRIVECAQMVVSDYGGEVPHTMKELQRLPGVGRKTANVVMCEAFKQAEGIAVDTHVFRIAHRLKFATRNDDTPDKVEAKLLKVYPRSDWININHQWVHFGRYYCSARSPKCATCFIADLCPSRE